ncbi:ATP-grasp domain-containing protein [Psychrobacter sp.]|uniref:ATP-grasp domain-containing protein n=1 Tax=Psychrobacter sp. TaxID=56811 RepID=UPI0025CD76D4|nr:ATP-grasp domain-containing protein [Psychrobacter sp.]
MYPYASEYTPSVWLAEGQSSQRDMLQSLQQLKQHSAKPFKVIASHRSQRPEIFEFADQVFIEPSLEPSLEPGVEPSLEPSLEQEAQSDLLSLPRWQFVMEQAIQANSKVILTGRNGIEYETMRAEFEKSGIRLLTGSTSVELLQKIDDKFAFNGHCQAHNIAAAEGWRFDTVQQLEQLLEEQGHQHLCVKPITGIFAQGFWCLDTHIQQASAVNSVGYDSFEHLYFTDNRMINTAQFVSAYRHSLMVKERPIPMLLMPYLPGKEYSIDVVCERGEVLAAVTRYKVGKVQHIGYDKSVMKLVIPLIRAFECDGFVSVQTKADEEGNHKVLEINSRPSGGIGNTVHSGVDLTQIGFGYWLGLEEKPNLQAIIPQIKPCQVRSIMSSVVIEPNE